MAEITAQLVKQLRDKTNAGMLDCQRALKESAGNLDQAADWLRKKGISRADGKSTRAAKEGLVVAHIAAEGKVGVLAEINCETDFVAKNDNFRAFVDTIVAQILTAESANNGSVDEFLDRASSDGKGSIGDAIKAKIGEIGENLVLRRFARYAADATSVVTTYIHMAGRVGVLIEASADKAGTTSSEAFRTLIKDLTLQIAASSPEYLSRADVPAAAVAREDEIQRERMAGQLTGKPEAIQKKIVEGSMGKFFAQICLLEQGFIKNPDQTVEDLIKSTAKGLGDTIRVNRFARYAVGEEIKG